MNLNAPQRLAARGQIDEARQCFPASGTSSDPRVDLLRARLEMDHGCTAEAIQILETLRASTPAYAPAALFHGIALWDTADVYASAEAFETVLKLQPANDLARSYKALCDLALGDQKTAAASWKSNGFSDNAMFRVRVVEFVESAWLRDKSFLGEATPAQITYAAKPSEKRALKFFYKRDFARMLSLLPTAPTDKELSAFLAATGHEMLRHYTAAAAYLEPFAERRSEWPDPLIALHARLLTRQGNLAEAATEFSKVLIIGPEDFGINYYLGIICLAYGKQSEARSYFHRALTQYMIDTLEFQWWQIEQVLLQNLPNA